MAWVLAAGVRCGSQTSQARKDEKPRKKWSGVDLGRGQSQRWSSITPQCCVKAAAAIDPLLALSHAKHLLPFWERCAAIIIIIIVIIHCHYYPHPFEIRAACRLQLQILFSAQTVARGAVSQCENQR